MKPDAALGGPARVVVLHAEAVEDLHRAIVHAHRDKKLIFPQRLPQQLPHAVFQFQQAGHVVELLLGHLKQIICFLAHWFSLG